MSTEKLVCVLDRVFLLVTQRGPGKSKRTQQSVIKPEKVREGERKTREGAHGQSWVPFFGSVFLVVKAKVHICEWYSCETIGTEKYQTVCLALVTCKTAKRTTNMKAFWEDKQLKTSTTPHCHSNRLILPLVCTGTLHVKCCVSIHCKWLIPVTEFWSLGMRLQFNSQYRQLCSDSQSRQ